MCPNLTCRKRRHEDSSTDLLRQAIEGCGVCHLLTVLNGVLAGTHRGLQRLHSLPTEDGREVLGLVRGCGASVELEGASGHSQHPKHSSL